MQNKTTVVKKKYTNINKMDTATALVFAGSATFSIYHFVQAKKKQQATADNALVSPPMLKYALSAVVPALLTRGVVIGSNSNTFNINLLSPQTSTTNKNFDWGKALACTAVGAVSALACTKIYELLAKK